MKPLVRSSQPSGARMAVSAVTSRVAAGVGPDERVGDAGQEGQQDLVGPVGDLEARITENPVIVPVQVGDAVLEDVLRCGRVPGIGRRQRVQVIQLPEEADLVQVPPPRLRLSLQIVEDVPAGDRGDLAGLARRRGRGLLGKCATQPGWHRALTPAQTGRAAHVSDQPQAGLLLRWPARR